jgi:hypothetical protein
MPTGGEESMSDEKRAKTMLTALWLFATLNYLYADVVSLIDPTSAYRTTTGAIQFTQRFLLEASILVEIPVAMVLLSRILKYRASRWANIIAGAIMTVVQTATLFVGTPTMYYAFFSIIEIVSTLAIVWFAWKWHELSSPRMSPTLAAPSR